MADFELQEGNGFIFLNKDKTEEKHPGLTGKFKVGGKLYKIALWGKKDEAGAFKHYGCRVEAFLSTEEYAAQQGASSHEATGHEPSSDADSGLPF